MQLKTQCFSNWGIVGEGQVTVAIIPSLLLVKMPAKALGSKDILGNKHI